VLTNGTLIDAALARRLARLGPAFVQVSIDGARASHDRIRGAGQHDRAVTGVKHLVREGVRTLISFTAHRANYREIVDVVRLARRLKVDRVWADRLIPAGCGESMRRMLLTPAETREFFQLMHREQLRSRRLGGGRTEVAMHRALQFLEAGGRPYHCTAGDSLVAVLPNGDLVPCRRLPIRVGNLVATPLAELYDGSPLLRALRCPDRTSRGCESCFYAKLCRGGLKCLSHAVTGDPFRADPGCWLASTGEAGATAGCACHGPPGREAVPACPP
jgi:radical SAM protein with 4Fe4S-binding SPASM domain